MPSPIQTISTKYDVSAYVLMGNPKGKARKAQVEYMKYLKEAGLSYASIAVVFGRSAGWVKSRLTPKKETP